MLTKVIFRKAFEFSSVAVPAVDLARYLNKAEGWKEDCKLVADLMHNYGLVYANDPRVDHSHNEIFLDQMEEYFERRSNQFDQGIKDLDTCGPDELPRGLKFAYLEKLPKHLEERQKLTEPNLPLTPLDFSVDPTWRYHWLVNSKNNIKPSDFPDFPTKMDNWGQQLFGTGLAISEMTAIGLGLQPNALSRTIQNGSLYLSPPGVDLKKTKLGDTLTGYHHDWTLCTVHGKCRYSGLYAWLLTQQKFLVKLPQKHILVQSGKQLQWITGGYIKAGFHEVIHNDLVQQKKQKNLRQGKSTWRVASTLFCHVQGDLSMKPFDKFRSAEVDRIYPDITGDEYLMQEYIKSQVDIDKN